MQFEPSTAVYDACRIIRERVPEAQTGQGENYPYLVAKTNYDWGFLCKDKERSINFTGRGEDFCSKKQYVGNVA